MYIKFNPEGKDTLTYGECLNPAMEITTKKNAEEYLKDYAAFIQKSLDITPNPNGLTAMQIAKTNIGYWTGYWDNETTQRVLELFDTKHPVFGRF